MPEVTNYDAENDILYVRIAESPNAVTTQFEDWLVETKDSETGEILAVQVNGFLGLLAEIHLERVLAASAKKVLPSVLIRMADVLIEQHQRDGLRKMIELLQQYEDTPKKERLPLARELVGTLEDMMVPKKKKIRREKHENP